MHDEQKVTELFEKLCVSLNDLTTNKKLNIDETSDAVCYASLLCLFPIDNSLNSLLTVLTKVTVNPIFDFLLCVVLSSLDANLLTNSVFKANSSVFICLTHDYFTTKIVPMFNQIKQKQTELIRHYIPLTEFVPARIEKLKNDTLDKLLNLILQGASAKPSTHKILMSIMLVLDSVQIEMIYKAALVLFSDNINSKTIKALCSFVNRLITDLFDNKVYFTLGKLLLLDLFETVLLACEFKKYTCLIEPLLLSNNNDVVSILSYDILHLVYHFISSPNYKIRLNSLYILLELFPVIATGNDVNSIRKDIQTKCDVLFATLNDADPQVREGAVEVSFSVIEHCSELLSPYNVDKLLGEMINNNLYDVNSVKSQISVLSGALRIVNSNISFFNLELIELLCFLCHSKNSRVRYFAFKLLIEPTIRPILTNSRVYNNDKIIALFLTECYLNSLKNTEQCTLNINLLGKFIYNNLYLNIPDLQNQLNNVITTTLKYPALNCELFRHDKIRQADVLLSSVIYVEALDILCNLAQGKDNFDEVTFNEHLKGLSYEQLIVVAYYLLRTSSSIFNQYKLRDDLNTKITEEYYSGISDRTIIELCLNCNESALLVLNFISDVKWEPPNRVVDMLHSLLTTKIKINTLIWRKSTDYLLSLKNSDPYRQCIETYMKKWTNALAHVISLLLNAQITTESQGSLCLLQLNNTEITCLLDFIKCIRNTIVSPDKLNLHQLTKLSFDSLEMISGLIFDNMLILINKLQTYVHTLSPPNSSCLIELLRETIVACLLYRLSAEKFTQVDTHLPKSLDNVFLSFINILQSQRFCSLLTEFYLLFIYFFYKSCLMFNCYKLQVIKALGFMFKESCINECLNKCQYMLVCSDYKDRMLPGSHITSHYYAYIEKTFYDHLCNLIYTLIGETKLSSDCCDLLIAFSEFSCSQAKDLYIYDQNSKTISLVKHISSVYSQDSVTNIDHSNDHELSPGHPSKLQQKRKVLNNQYNISSLPEEFLKECPISWVSCYKLFYKLITQKKLDLHNIVSKLKQQDTEAMTDNILLLLFVN